MSGWQQFFLVAGAHFLALLSPGPDFFLILRSALRHGAGRASGVCLGIALANGVYIVIALTGVSLLSAGGAVFELLRWGGAAYLLWLAWGALRAKSGAASTMLADVLPAAGKIAAHRWSAWVRELSAGFLSGILNPKNAFFYASLFAFVGTDSVGFAVLLGYGLWMFFAVIAWDLFVAHLAGHRSVVRRLAEYDVHLSRASGAVFLALAVLLVWED